jgi:hypothetical protein
MIEINISGRLGNQMFQYAFARSLQERKKGEDINLCFKFKNGTVREQNLLQDFNVKHFYTDNKIHPSFIQKIIIYAFRVIRKILNIKTRMEEQVIELKYQKVLNFFGIYWLTQGYYDFPIRNVKNTILVGYFESEKYFESIKEKIKNEFIPKHDIIPANYDLYKKIETKESVCLAIRRGDFIADEHVKKAAFVCAENYFYKAIEEIKQKINNPVFFIFSNDIKWVQENMDFGKETEIYFESKSNPNWETMRLMYSCKHFIISNSTFHWWAQYLSKNEDKIVIAPSRWRNYKVKLDIYDSRWILIDP